MDVDFNQNVMFNYRLNENWKHGSNAQIQKIAVSKDKWIGYISVQEELKDMIRSKTNPNGVVDYTITQKERGEVLYSSLASFQTPVEFYSLEALQVMNRDKLTTICRTWGIDPRHKQDDFLRKLISKCQDDFPEYRDVKSIHINKETGKVSFITSEEPAVEITEPALTEEMVEEVFEEVDKAEEPVLTQEEINQALEIAQEESFEDGEDGLNLSTDSAAEE